MYNSRIVITSVNFNLFQYYPIQVHILYSYDRHLAHRLQDAPLNGELSFAMKKAKVLIEHWRNHYKTRRPYSALGIRSPAPEVVIPSEMKGARKRAKWPPSLT